MRHVAPGTSVAMRVVVTPADQAAVDGEVVHPVDGTAAMLRHVEQVSRWLLAMALEPGEEGVGRSISLKHRAPVPVGAEVELVATVLDCTPATRVTEVVVQHDGDPVAVAGFTQAVVDAETFGRFS